MASPLELMLEEEPVIEVVANPGETNNPLNSPCAPMHIEKKRNSLSPKGGDPNLSSSEIKQKLVEYKL